MMELPKDIWDLVIDQIGSLPDGSAASWSRRTTDLANVARVCKTTEVSAPNDVPCRTCETKTR